MIRNCSTAGGYVITRPKPITYNAIDEPHTITLMSDLHIGAIDTDYECIDTELKRAQEEGHRILLNGDLFDLIFPVDHKRFRPDTLHPHIQGRADILNATLEMAYDVLSPYKDSIDMIGLGNHESAAEKYHSVDIIALLLDRLATDNRRIAYGGYTGFVKYQFEKSTGNNRLPLVIYYHHGSGGSAPVTRGMIDFNRKQTWVDADVIWLAHKHNRLSDATPQRMRCPVTGDDPIIEEVRCIMTGGYRRSGLGQSQEEIQKMGRRSNYAIDGGMSPQGIGGARLIIRVKEHRSTERRHIYKYMEVIQ